MLEINYRENKALTKFEANITTYDDWAEEMVGHLNRTNRAWADVLKWVQSLTDDSELKPQVLSSRNIHGANAWWISQTLEPYILTWVSKTLKKQ